MVCDHLRRIKDVPETGRSRETYQDRYVQAGRRFCRRIRNEAVVPLENRKWPRFFVAPQNGPSPTGGWRRHWDWRAPCNVGWLVPIGPVAVPFSSVAMRDVKLR